MDNEEKIKKIGSIGNWSEGAARDSIRTNFRCEYCDKDFLESVDNYKLWEADHIIPKSKGGTDEEENMAITCRTCNWSFKSDFDPRTKAGENADREELIRVVKKYIESRRQKTEIEMEEIRKIVGYHKKST